MQHVPPVTGDAIWLGVKDLLGTSWFRTGPDRNFSKDATTLMPYVTAPTGSSYYDNVRPLAYPDSDAVLICFDISRPETLDSVIKKVSALFFSLQIHLLPSTLRIRV